MQSWNCCTSCFVFIGLFFKIKKKSRNIFPQQAGRWNPPFWTAIWFVNSLMAQQVLKKLCPMEGRRLRHTKSPSVSSLLSWPLLSSVWSLPVSGNNLFLQTFLASSCSFVCFPLVNALCSPKSAYSYLQTMERLHQLAAENRNLTGELLNVGNHPLTIIWNVLPPFLSNDKSWKWWNILLFCTRNMLSRNLSRLCEHK